MAGMQNLIRVQKWKLDEKRREVTDLENLLANFNAQLTKLNNEQVKEQQLASSDPEASLLYANYAKAAKIRRENLMNSVEDMEEKIEVAREEMAEVFQELKKFEISEENRLRLLKEQQDKRQQAEMDAFSLEIYRRKSKQ